MVEFSLSPEQKALRVHVRNFSQTVLATASATYSAHPTQTARFQSTIPIYRAAVASGLIKSLVPVSLGGLSNGLIDLAILTEEIQAVDTNPSITILGTGLGLMPLVLGGTQELQEKYLKPFLQLDGEPLASFVHSEPGGTANWLEKGGQGLQTTAWKEGDEWVINGEKLWTTNSSGWDNRGATLQSVVCRESKVNVPQDPATDPASHILILLITREDIAKNDPGAYQVLSDPELGGHRAVNGPHSRFTNFRVPQANLLAKPGEGAQIVEKAFGMSSGMVGAMCLGVMRHAFEAALAFCKEDTRRGTVPIIERPSVADRLIDAKCKIEAGRALTWKAMSVLESTDPGIIWEQRLEIALEAKIWCSDAAPQAVLECMSVVGMKSYSQDMPFSKLLEEAACYPLFDGGNVGIRRRQIEAIFKSDTYDAWGATYTT